MDWVLDNADGVSLDVLKDDERDDIAQVIPLTGVLDCVPGPGIRIVGGMSVGVTIAFNKCLLYLRGIVCQECTVTKRMKGEIKKLTSSLTLIHSSFWRLL